MADRLEMLRHGREDLEVMPRERMPNAEVWVCGRSRVNDRCHSDSDLDLAWRSPTLGSQGLERVEPMARSSWSVRKYVPCPLRLVIRNGMTDIPR